MSTNSAWPVIAGSYEVGDLQGSVAICVLTSERLMAPLAHLPGVAIAGMVYTANLGITRIVLNLTANPAIRFLLICGKDSPLFHPGQSLVALAEHGVDAENQIVGAIGYDPVVPTLVPEHVSQFRRQVEVIDWAGEEDLRLIEERIAGLVARSPGRFLVNQDTGATAMPDERITAIRPGGRREPLQYDPKGYFVITLDRAQEQIVLRHYLPDHTPAHEMRGRAAGSMLLGLLREGLISQLSHAGYLGEELAKAEAALRLELRYDQDRPLRPRETPTASLGVGAPPEQGAAPDSGPTPTARPPMAAIQPPLTWAQLESAAPGAPVSVAVAVTDLFAPNHFAGTLLEPDEAEPFNAFHRTPHQVQVRWTPTTQIAMGGPADIAVGALMRARGTLSEGRDVDAQALVVLTRVARIIGS